MSWLWDVEFDTLREGGVDQLSGSRAYDMAPSAAVRRTSRSAR